MCLLLPCSKWNLNWGNLVLCYSGERCLSLAFIYYKVRRDRWTVPMCQLLCSKSPPTWTHCHLILCTNHYSCITGMSNTQSTELLHLACWATDGPGNLGAWLAVGGACHSIWVPEVLVKWAPVVGVSESYADTPLFTLQSLGPPLLPPPLP